MRELFQIFKNENVENELQENAEYLLDDLFYYTENMQKLKENISQILCRNKEEQQKGKIDTPDFFEKIENYMKEQLAACRCPPRRYAQFLEFPRRISASCFENTAQKALTGIWRP